MFDNLNDENILLYAIKGYDRPNMVMSEFEEDMKRYNYLNRLFTRYRRFNDLREQLVINHLIVLYNVFGPEIATRLLFYKIPEINYPVLKTYLIFLNLMPEKIKGIRGKDLISSDILLDVGVSTVLRKIK
jgi:deoxyadenosine/deoxycytidine kinase